MNRTTLIRLAVATCVLMVALEVVNIALDWNKPGRQFLRAIEVEHTHRSSDEFGDHVHLVKGRIKDVPMEDLAKILKLPSHTTKALREVEPGSSGWQLFPGFGWWKLPDGFDEIYYEMSPGSQCLLGRRGDSVYLQDLTW